MTKRKLKPSVVYFFIFLLLILFLFFFLYCNMHSPLPIIKNGLSEEEKLQKEQKYAACLLKPYEKEEEEYLASMKQELNNTIIKNKYNVSIYYEDLQTGFSYSYQPTKVYYGCSLIKLVDALYLINKAIAGEIDLDAETVTYTQQYVRAFSSYMEKKNIGDRVSLRDLIRYAISASDNSAHLMLLDYIGFSKLKSYGESLGAKVILTGGDYFGNQTAEDTNIYLKEAYRIIRENEEYGSFLKEIMDNDDRNAFNTDTIRIYHKYGSYGDNYHDIGLSLKENPYAISILTLHENSGYQNIIQELHNKIIALHNQFYENRELLCYEQIYE